MGWNCEIQTLFHGYRFLVYKDYLTFYTVDKEKASVHILTVFNGKKDYMRVMGRYL